MSTLMPGDARVDETPEPAPEPPLRTGQRLGDYTLAARLGRGAAGEVYRAHGDDGQVVAVKILRADQSPARQELRFRREFRAIARLDHPHVLRVLGEGRSDDGARFMITEYAAGGDLRRMVGVTDTPELVAVVLQVASALDYVHSQRIVHRDLKPENVLLFPAEHGGFVAKLADFGIAWFDPGLARPMTAAGKLMGTVDFVAPELVRGEPADPRSDLYALGVMSFEIASGRVPFEGSMWQVLQARVTDRAPPLCSVAPHLPAAFGDLVDRLLATDPRDRPPSAHLVCSELAAVLAALPDSGGVAERVLAGLPAPTGAFLYRPAIVGRDGDVAAILATIVAALDGQSGAPVALALVGEAGLGKTAVTRLVERELSARGILHVTHMLAGDATRPPFAPFQAIERDLAVRAGAADADVAPSADGSWISARPLLADPRDVVAGRFLASDDAAAWRRRRVRRVLEYARSATPRSGLVLVIEDVHEMDGGAWALVSDLLRALGDAARTGQVRPFLLLSARPSAHDPLAQLEPAGLVVHTLGDLDEEAVRQTAAAMLGSGTSALPDGLVRQTLAECRGNPLLVQSYLLALVGGGELRRVRGGWALRSEARTGRLPTQMANVLRARLALLSSATREVLGVAAALGVHFEVPLLVSTAVAVAAGARDADMVLDALDEALKAGILEAGSAQASYSENAARAAPPPAGERTCVHCGRPAAGPSCCNSTTVVVDIEVLKFSHKRLAEVLYEELALPTRLVIHDHIGRALLARGESVPAILARHFGAGSDDQQAVTWLGAAVDEALAAHDHASVELHLRRLVPRLEALGLPTVPTREALGDALLAQGQGAGAEPIFTALREAPADALTRARWLRKEGLARFLSADTVGGIAALEAALAALGDQVPRSRFGIRWRVARDLIMARFGARGVIAPEPDVRLEERMACHRWLGTLFRWVDLERVAAHSAAQLRLAERSGDVGHRTYAYSVHAVFWAFVAAPRRAAKMEALAQRLAEARHDDGARAFIELMRGATALLGENPGACMDHFDSAVALAHKGGDRFLEVLTSSGRGWAAMMLGRWSLSNENFAHAYTTADGLDIAWMRADAGVGHSLVQVAMGHHTEGVARARALADDATLGLPAVRALATEILGGAEYIRGRYAEARILLADACQQYHHHHLDRGWGYLSHIEHSETLLWQVDRDGADSVPDLLKLLRSDALHARRTIGKIPIFRGFDDIMRGVIAARRGQRDKALKLFDRGRARRIGPSESYLDTWMNIRIAIERMRLGGARVDAQHALDEVGATFESAGLRGMLAWLVQMRSELGL